MTATAISPLHRPMHGGPESFALSSSWYASSYRWLGRCLVVVRRTPDQAYFGHEHAADLLGSLTPRRRSAYRSGEGENLSDQAGAPEIEVVPRVMVEGLLKAVYVMLRPLPE